MNLLVTGANGFLGRECVAQLRQRGHEVVTTDKHGQIDLTGDLASDEFCRRLPEVDTVIHCAAVQYVSPNLPLLRRRAYFHLNNVVATRNLATRYLLSRAHFINVGTSMMYEQTGLQIYETTSPMKGQGLYSESKLQAQAYVDRMPNRSATVIPCIIGGRGREGLFRGFVNLMTRYGLVVFPGTGRHRTHMVHVEDVASLIVKVGETQATGRYNAAAPQPLSIREWIAEIESTLNLQPVRCVRVPLAATHWLSAVLGYRLLAKEQLLMLAQDHVLSTVESVRLGWQPKHTNASIVRDIARYIVGTKKVKVDPPEVGPN